MSVMMREHRTGLAPAVTTTAVTGVGLALPGGVTDPAQLLTGGPHGSTVEPSGDGTERVDPTALVGRRGLRYKDRATQLAYCAVAAALRDADHPAPDGADHAGLGPETAVVVSSNLGNLDTVCATVATIDRSSAARVSPMDLPNASSNVIASSLAIRFGATGPNLMLCNGVTSGLDALYWADTLVRSGRARSVLVVGVEPDTEPVRRLAGDGTVFDGAVALLVTGDPDPGVAVRAVLGGYVRTGGRRDCLDRLTAAEGGALTTLPGDLANRWGDPSGALGLLLAAGAVGWFAGGARQPVGVLVGDDRSDAVAGMVLRPAEELS